MIAQTILIGENDKKFIAALAEHLKVEGLAVRSESSWNPLFMRTREELPPMVIINTTLEGFNGVDTVKDLRPLVEGLIVLISDKQNELDEILSFEYGVDDFIVKPVHIRVLIARICALLRKNSRIKKIGTNGCISVGKLTVDSKRREAFLNGKSIDLTTVQFDLLWYLIKKAGDVVSRDELFQVVRNTDYNGIDRSIDVYISRIRQRLGDDPKNPYYLKTVRGIGYLFASEKDNNLLHFSEKTATSQ